MTRNECLKHIRAELAEIIANYIEASDKSKPHKIRAGADGILAMLQGFGGVRPQHTVECNNKFKGVYIEIRDGFEPEGEPENTTKEPTAEALLAQGICPCGRDSFKGCSGFDCLCPCHKGEK